MLDSMEVTRATHGRRAPRYQPKPWERVEDGILHGPGYAYDLENDDLLFFQAPSTFVCRPRDGGGGAESEPAPDLHAEPSRKKPRVERRHHHGMNTQTASGRR